MLIRTTYVQINLQNVCVPVLTFFIPPRRRTPRPDNSDPISTYPLEMATGRAARAGPENPGPRALRAETGLKYFI